MRIGIDVGGTKIAAIALGEAGAVLAERRAATPRDDYEATVGAITGLVHGIESELGRSGSVGVGIPGAESLVTGRIKNANSVWLIDRPLAGDLARALDRPVRLANDANCFALSEATDGAAAGADVVFPDALPSEEDFRAFAEAVQGPKMANMTEFGRTPYFTTEKFQDMGYAIVIWPATSMRVAAGAMAELYAHIREHGGAEALIGKMPTRDELYQTIGYYDYEALDESIAKSVVPEAPGE